MTNDLEDSEAVRITLSTGKALSQMTFHIFVDPLHIIVDKPPLS